METTRAPETTPGWRVIAFGVVPGLFALVTHGFGVMFAVGSLVAFVVAGELRARSGSAA